MTTLTDDALRAEYDDLLTNGIPWHEQYYGKYAYRFTGHSHDIRVHRQAKNSSQYKLELEKTGLEPVVFIPGGEMPTFHDLFVVQLVKLPFRAIKALYVFIVINKFEFQTKTPEQIEDEHRISLHMTVEEYAKQKADYLKKVERIKSSGRYKQMLRAQRK
eukprot:gene8225-9672_t